MEITLGKPKTTPKDFFLYVGVMALLYGSITALINLLFAYINFSFPDVLNVYYDPFSDTIRWAMAFLLILFPAFLVGTWFINKDLRANPDKDSIGIRKWLTYLALFVAGAAILVDLSVLVYTFLGGEISTRFVLKVAVVLVVATFVLAYYLLDLRGKIRENKKTGQIFGAVAIVLVLGSIVSGFFIVGSPATQRALRFDQQRISDLQNIQWQIVNYWQQRQEFPKSLSALNDPLSGFTVPKDPETSSDYEYTLGEGYAFELCATFAKESRGGAGDKYTQPVPAVPIFDGGFENETWQHPAGKYCFERILDPKRYPPFDKTAPRI